MTDAAHTRSYPVTTEDVARAIHDALGGNGWAYSDYGGDEWNNKRSQLRKVAAVVMRMLAPAQAGKVPTEVWRSPASWKSPIETVADLVNNLLTLDQAMEVHGAYHIDFGEDRCRARGLSLSREHVTNGRIKPDETVPYSLVIWTGPERSPSRSPWQPIDAAPKTDRTTIIVWDDPVMGEAYYDIEEKSWWWANTGSGDYTAKAIYPTLWRPMPAPPSMVPSTHQPCPECEANGLCARHASTEGK